MSLKYNVVYKVTISGEEIGYVKNKYQFEKLVDKEVLKPETVNVAYVDIEELPKYEMVLADTVENINEDEVLEKIGDIAVTTYKVYAIAVNNENAVYVNTKIEAEETVEKIKEEYSNALDKIEISVNEIYTQDFNDIESGMEVAESIEMAEANLSEIVKEQEIIKNASLDGVYFAVKPVSGIITSRFGQVEDIRDHAHSGLDISAPCGTTIVAAAKGKVTFSGVMGGYGNLIIITHENNIQTYYGHCSKLYAKVGDEVEAGDKIAAVGSTGYSTGNHLHFEIRKNGSTLNPQKYLYK